MRCRILQEAEEGRTSASEAASAKDGDVLRMEKTMKLLRWARAHDLPGCALSRLWSRAQRAVLRLNDQLARCHLEGVCTIT